MYERHTQLAGMETAGCAGRKLLQPGRAPALTLQPAAGTARPVPAAWPSARWRPLSGLLPAPAPQFACSLFECWKDVRTGVCMAHEHAQVCHCVRACPIMCVCMHVCMPSSKIDELNKMQRGPNNLLLWTQVHFRTAVKFASMLFLQHSIPGLHQTCWQSM